MTRKNQDQPDPIEPEPEIAPEEVPDDGPHTFDLGATVPLAGHTGLMRLPDGTVVTSRGHYVPQHVGEHAFIVTKDGEQVEITFVVVDPNAEPEQVEVTFEDEA
jgi:hypothetical protein